jgi:hypothetical protein
MAACECESDEAAGTRRDPVTDPGAAGGAQQRTTGIVETVAADCRGGGIMPGARPHALVALPPVVWLWLKVSYRPRDHLLADRVIVRETGRVVDESA